MFRKQFSAIGKTDQTGKGQFGQFTVRGDSWPKCLSICWKLNLWKIDLKWRGYGKKGNRKEKNNLNKSLWHHKAHISMTSLTNLNSNYLIMG